MTKIDPQSMTLPLALLLIGGAIGSVDVVYYHLWKFRLFDAPSARAETVTHLLRGALFSAGTYMVASYRPAGVWFWVVGALFALDFVNNVFDVALESRSRTPLGGVPRTEQIVHSIGSMLAGAIAASYFVLGWTARNAPTALVSTNGALPNWLIWQGRTMGSAAALLTLFELGLLLRSLIHTRTSTAR